MLVISRDIFYLTVAAGSALTGARHDLKCRRIPNLLTGLSLVSGLALHLFLGGPGDLGLSALAGLIAGATLLLMYLAGGMGAGDVKLMAAVCCLAGFPFLRTILIGTFFSGAVFGIALALYHRRLKQLTGESLVLVGQLFQHGLHAGHQPFEVELDTSRSKGLSMPYAVPIAAGCLIALGTQIWKG